MNISEILSEPIFKNYFNIGWIYKILNYLNKFLR